MRAMWVCKMLYWVGGCLLEMVFLDYSRRLTRQKLVPVVWYQELARVSVNLVPVSFWYQFLVRNGTQLSSVTETMQHVRRTVQRDWPESCFGARHFDELVSNFSWKFLVAVSVACVAGIRTCAAVHDFHVVNQCDWQVLVLILRHSSLYDYSVHVFCVWVICWLSWQSTATVSRLACWWFVSVGVFNGYWSVILLSYFLSYSLVCVWNAVVNSLLSRLVTNASSTIKTLLLAYYQFIYSNAD